MSETERDLRDPQEHQRSRGGTSGTMAECLYDDLRRAARRQMGARNGRPLTLTPTALVHEAYLRLSDGGQSRWEAPGHFHAAASVAMQRILIERARRRGRIRHGGNRKRIAIDSIDIAEAQDPFTLPDIERALQGLAEYHARKSHVIALRLLAGLTISQTAEALGVSPATVKNDWNFARAWLQRELDRIGDSREAIS